MNRRDVLKAKAARTNDPTDWANFKVLRNRKNNDIKNPKKAYFNTALNNSTNNSRRMWKIINDITNRKCNKAAINEVELEGSIQDQL